MLESHLVRRDYSTGLKQNPSKRGAHKCREYETKSSQGNFCSFLHFKDRETEALGREVPAEGHTGLGLESTWPGSAPDSCSCLEL